MAQFLESFAGKRVSSSEDRLEETKRRKLAIKAQKLVELMMVSGIGTSSGFEERIRFSEIEFVDSNAIDTGVMNTIPEGNYINGWDVNVAGVRQISVKRNIRQHKHAEFLLRIKQKGELEHFVGRRYGDFAKLHKRLKTELPGRILPPLPKKNKSSTTTSALWTGWSNADDSDASSVSSVSTRRTGAPPQSGGRSSLLSPSASSTSLRSSLELVVNSLTCILGNRPGSTRSIHSSKTPRISVDSKLSLGLSADKKDSGDDVCFPPDWSIRKGV